ncbi:MAG: sulfatase [Carboxylicivirga sp.]|jgi:arylsulfatase A-like enzyme|nr:sulfatase [Carboxylicivirga sp.]
MKKMKNLLVIVFMVISAMANATTDRSKGNKTQKPNIIHILADDVGFDDLSCFGSKYILTPNLDQLANDGCKFTNFMAPHATCTPSRAALLTGRYAPRINNGEGVDVLWPTSKTGMDPEQEISIARLLKKQGYSSAIIGKWHLGHLPQFLPLAHGFDYFFGIPYPNDHGPERYGNTGSRKLPKIPLIVGDSVVKRCDNNDLAELPALFTREACHFIQKNAKEGTPFFLQLSNIETHTPWFVPKGFEGKSPIGAYGDAVMYLDYTVGIIMNYLKKMKIENNTLVLFSSDNGPLVYRYPELEACYGKYATVDEDREHILRDGKYQARFEGGPRVACIVKWPGMVKESTTNDELIGGFDFFTTFVNIAGGEIPEDRVIDGKDILPILKGEEGAKSPHEVFYGFTGHGLLQSVRKGNWKLAVPGKGHWASEPLKEPLLYDLSNDLGEEHNIANDHPEIVKELMKLAKKGKEAIKKNKSMP